MSNTRTPCGTCGSPSGAAQFLAGFLRHNLNPALNQLAAAASLEVERAQERADRAAGTLAAAEGELTGAQAAADKAAARSARALADVEQQGLPIVLAERVRSHAEESAVIAAAATARVEELVLKVTALRLEAEAAATASGQVAADTFTEGDLRFAYGELGLVEDSGLLHPISEPSEAQLRSRALCNL